ncbi:MAG: hypothetical protein AB7K24_17840 [Gemmataceae bacterium]
MTTEPVSRPVRWPLWLAGGLFVYSVICLSQLPGVQAQRDGLPRLTCAELVQQNGPGSHAYIALTDAKLASDHGVIRRDPLSPGGMDMYVPIYPAALGKEPPAADMRLILDINDDRERDRLTANPEPGEIIASVRRAGPELDAWAKQRLERSYPGLPVDQCWLVIVGLHEPSARKSANLYQHGVSALVLAGVMVLGWWMWQARRRATASAP